MKHIETLHVKGQPLCNSKVVLQPEFLFPHSEQLTSDHVYCPECWRLKAMHQREYARAQARMDMHQRRIQQQRMGFQHSPNGMWSPITNPDTDENQYRASPYPSARNIRG
jgi:hypothetical protein